MKKILLLSLIICSCSPTLKRMGKIETENGKKENVEIMYSVSHDAFSNIKLEDLHSIVTASSFGAEINCNHPETFIPKSIEITMRKDTLNASVFFSASNSLGVLDDGFSNSQYLKNGKEWKIIMPKQ